MRIPTRHGSVRIRGRSTVCLIDQGRTIASPDRMCDNIRMVYSQERHCNDERVDGGVDAETRLFLHELVALYRSYRPYIVHLAVVEWARYQERTTTPEVLAGEDNAA